MKKYNEQYKKFEQELESSIGHETIEPDIYEYMQKAKKDIFKKIIIGTGITGLLFYLYTAAKSFFLKAGTAIVTHKIIAGAVIAATVTAGGSYIAINKIFSAKTNTAIEKMASGDEEINLHKNEDKPDLSKEKVHPGKPDRYIIGIESFEINIEQNKQLSKITDTIERTINRRHGTHFSKILTGTKTNCDYILSGMIDMHSKIHFRISMKLYSVKTSRIVKMDTKVTDSIDTINATIIKMTNSLIKGIQ